MNSNLISVDSSDHFTRSNFKFSLIGSSTLLLLLLLIDSIFSSKFMQLSVKLSLALQQLNLTTFCLFLSYVVFFGLFAYVFFIFTIRQDLQNNLLMAIGVCLMIYSQAAIKLVLVDTRPLFEHPDLNSDFCICDYGKPSGHSLCTAGLLLFVYDDIKRNSTLSRITDFMIKFSFIITALFIGFSRVYLAAHSLNQIVLGFTFGIVLYYFIRHFEDEIRKFIFLPILYKERVTNKKGIFYILSLMLLSNYGLFQLYAYRYVYFERIENKFFRFSNCFECLDEFNRNFSVKIMKDGLVFNILFGLFIGIYLTKGSVYEFRGLFHDSSICRYIGRALLLLLFCLPITLILIDSSSVTMLMIKTAVIPIITGYLIMHPFAHLVRRVKADKPEEDKSESVVVFISQNVSESAAPIKNCDLNI